MAFSSDEKNRNFTLGQERENLILRLRTPTTGKEALSPQVTLCTLGMNIKTHIIITYMDGNLFIYKNGKLESYMQDIRGDFSPWESKAQFIIGDELTGDCAWRGTMYNIAIYSRFITEQEAQFKYQIAIHNSENQLQGRFF